MTDNKKYETPLLNDKTCLQCGMDFVYYVNPKKRKFKKKDFSFYLLKTDGGDQQPTYYLHPKCLLPLLKSDYYRKKDGKLVINSLTKQPISLMTMCDRFGEPLYKTNYVKKLAGLLQSEYEKECRDDFISNIKHLYRGVSDYPYIYYEFKGDREKFDHIKRKCNKRMRNRVRVLL